MNVKDLFLPPFGALASRLSGVKVSDGFYYCNGGVVRHGGRWIHIRHSGGRGFKQNKN